MRVVRVGLSVGFSAAGVSLTPWACDKWMLFCINLASFLEPPHDDCLLLCSTNVGLASFPERSIRRPFKAVSCCSFCPSLRTLSLSFLFCPLLPLFFSDKFFDFSFRISCTRSLFPSKRFSFRLSISVTGMFLLTCEWDLAFRCTTSLAVTPGKKVYNWGHVLLGLFRLFLFWNRTNRIHRISVPNKTDHRYSENRIGDQKRPARTRNFPAGILFRPFCYREQNERNSIPFIPE